MNKLRTGLLIIGAGPGGYVAALYAQKKGIQVTLVEKDEIGGTCLNVGCIPTKSFIRSAHLYHDAMNSLEYGIQAESVRIDLPQVVLKKNTITKQLVSGIEFLLNKYGVQVLKGKAEFVNDKLVKVQTNIDEFEVEADDIIIATGAKTKHLPIPGIDIENVLDSTELLSNTKMPKSLNIIGGGIIGLEFAFIFGQMGVPVNVIEFLPTILPSIDKEYSQRLLRYAKQNNITIFTSSQVTEIEKLDNGNARIYFVQKDVQKSLESELILEAVGRVPNLESLKLENTHIQFSNRGISVDSRMKTNIDHLYAIGDVTNIMQLAHVASHQAIVAVDQIMHQPTQMHYDAIPSVIFTTPQIAVVGKTENQLMQSGLAYHTLKVPFSANGKALILDSATGFIKLLIDSGTNKVVGAGVFGEDAEHLIANLTIMIQNQLSPEAIKSTVFAHPTTSELIHEAGLGLIHEAIHFVE